ncbi:MAG: aldo/keto reductase, partial [Thermoplasmata archaeon]
AVALDVNFIDTADIYQSNASETTIGRALHPLPSGVVVATKGGMIRPSGVDGHPEYLRRAVEGSLQRLGLDCLPLYQLHRVDPTVPIEESVGALRDMRAEGKIRDIGLSNVTVEEIERARRVVPIASVQNQYNIHDRRSENVVDFCTEHEIAFLPWTPLMRGDLRAETTLGEVATQYAVTAHQLALRWLLRRSPWILPIPGTLSERHLEENLAAASIDLSDADFERLSG